MATYNDTIEPDDVIPPDSKSSISKTDTMPDPTKPSPLAAAGHPYGDDAYSEGARSTLDRLRKGAPYGAAGGSK